MPSIHEPVLLDEVLEALAPQPGKNYIDCTFGGGGHSLALMEKIKPTGIVLGIDWDRRVAQDSVSRNLILVNDNYRNLEKIYQRCQKQYKLGEINGILLDLGLSSDQLEDEDRGFSFQSVGDLDMRFDDASSGQTAGDILMSYSEKELIEIFREYGEESLAVPIAKAIVGARNEGENLRSAEMLVRLITDIYRRKFRAPSKKNPATKVLQALRIVVNDEYGNIRSALPKAIDVLAKGGRLAVISFHSGEDRLVKNFFREMSASDYPRIKLINKKPIIATSAELEKNPRARSAKLRVIEKL